MAKWLMKSEPGSYSWEQLVRDGGTEWDGVRNAAARLHLKAMEAGDEALFYHSGEQRAVVGTMTVTRRAKPDGPDGKWASVAVAPQTALARPVTLREIKADPSLAGIELVRQSRLSVAPIRQSEWTRILQMAAQQGPV